MNWLRAAILAAWLLGLSAAGPGAVQPSRGPAPATAAVPSIPARIGLVPAFAGLDERADCAGSRPGILYLTVQNEGTTELVVRFVRLLAPSDLELCLGTAASAGHAPSSAVTLNQIVGAGRRAVIPLRIGTRETPRPGSVPLLVEVELSARVDGAERIDRLLASDRIELRIPGLSEILRLVGIPTLFLLPGVLVLGAFSLIYTPKEEKRLAPNNLGFWIISISISVILSVLYTVGSGLVGRARDLIDRFNLVDVAIVWAISLMLGFAAGMVAILRRRKRQTTAAQNIADRTITRQDDPNTILDKLERLGTRWPLHWHTAGTHRGFLVEPGGGSPPWLIPQAGLRTKPAQVDKADWNRARAALAEATKDQSSLPNLRAALKAADVAILMPLAWRDGKEPYQLDEDADPTRGDDRVFLLAE